MNKLDKIDIDILRDLISREIESLKNDKSSIGRKEYEAYLRRIDCKLEKMRDEKNN